MGGICCTARPCSFWQLPHTHARCRGRLPRPRARLRGAACCHLPGPPCWPACLPPTVCGALPRLPRPSLPALRALPCAAAAWRVDDYLGGGSEDEGEDLDLSSLRQHRWGRRSWRRASQGPGPGLGGWEQ